MTACLKQLMDKCVAGAKVLEICQFGDKYVAEETSKVFKKEKEMKKGKTHYLNIQRLTLIPNRWSRSRD